MKWRATNIYYFQKIINLELDIEFFIQAIVVLLSTTLVKNHLKHSRTIFLKKIAINHQVFYEKCKIISITVICNKLEISIVKT